MVLIFGRRFYRLLTTVLSEDTFIFYRTTGRVVHNGQFVCALSQIDHVILEPKRGGTGLSLALKDGRQIEVASSLWEDREEVAEAVADFVGVEAVTPRGS